MMKNGLLALVILLTLQGHANPQDDTLPKVRTNDVNVKTLVVSIVDQRSAPIKGFEKDDFSVFDDKVMQKIVAFDDKDVPFSLGILFDVSPSILSNNLDAVEAARTGVLDFVKSSNDLNEYFLIGFSDRVQLLADWTNNRSAIRDAVSKLPSLQTNASGGTKLYDALYAGLDRLSGGGNLRKGLLLITDGVDTGSIKRFGELKTKLKNTDLLLYVLAICPEFGECLSKDLYDLAWESGGNGYFFHKRTPMWRDQKVNVTDVGELLNLIALQLRHPYSISYIPSNPSLDGKWHRVDVKVRKSPKMLPRPASVHVQHRRGYFASSN